MSARHWFALALLPLTLTGCPTDAVDTDGDTEAEVDTDDDTEADTEPDTEADTEADTDGDTEADTDPDTTPVVDTTWAPLNDFALYSSGCDDEIWGRWTNDEDFLLDTFVARNAVNEQQYSQTWFSPLRFIGGEQDTFLLIDSGDFTDTTDWTWGFDFRNTPDRAITTAVSSTLPPSTGRFSAVTPTRVVDLEIGAVANFNGYIQRVRYYSDAQCWRQTSTFFGTGGSSNDVVSGQSRQIPDVPDTLQAGSTVFITLEGWDSDIGYTFYDVIEVDIP